jgi:hypothetical protein
MTYDLLIGFELSEEWRRFSFTALNGTATSKWKQTVLDETHALVKDCLHVDGDILDDFLNGVDQILMQAYDWNANVKSTATRFDYRPVLLDDGALEHEEDLVEYPTSKNQGLGLRYLVVGNHS